MMGVKINAGMKNIIENNALGFATVDQLGNPHNVAVGYVKVTSEKQLVVSNNYLNETIENIKTNPNVALVAWNRKWEENCVGYELRGTAQHFNEGKWFDFIKEIPENEGEPCKGAILIEVNKIKVLS